MRSRSRSVRRGLLLVRFLRERNPMVHFVDSKIRPLSSILNKDKHQPCYCTPKSCNVPLDQIQLLSCR